jgi:hydroxymethylpyrimidine pyrophosphatase-like HAD family hydrolase
MLADMRYFALAVDFDGTLAHDGYVRPETVVALHQLRATGRKLVLVTGRRLPELEAVFTELVLFDRVVGENGAVIFNPADRSLRALAPPPPEMLLERLRKANVPFQTGHAIVALWEPHAAEAFSAIAELGLEYWVSFNKGAVMLLPSGHTKATGLEAALSDLGLSPLNAVAIGDAENDHSMLAACELGVAVGNAVPALHLSADVSLAADHGAGVEEVAYALIRDDLSGWDADSDRRLTLGLHNGESVWVSTSGPVVLITGASGVGKSSYALGILTQLMAGGYQAVVVDPEGDYHDESLGAAVIGSAVRDPAIESIEPLIQEPRGSVIICILGIEGARRRKYFAELLDLINHQREATGRPHWLVFDEAHHLFYDSPDLPTALQRAQLRSTVLVTLHPEKLTQTVLRQVTHVVALSEPSPEIDWMARMLGVPPPTCGDDRDGLAMLWRVGERTTTTLDVAALLVPHTRHARKYAESDLGEKRSFYFRQFAGGESVRAANVLEFAALLGDIDETTWRFHQERGDFARWLRECINDEELAGFAEACADSTGARWGRLALQRRILEKYVAW